MNQRRNYTKFPVVVRNHLALIPEKNSKNENGETAANFC